MNTETNVLNPPATETSAPEAAGRSVPNRRTPSQEAESDYDQAQLETVHNSEEIARAAKREENNATLLGEGMLGDTPDALLAACRQWRDLSRQAHEASEGGEQATGMGDDAETVVRQLVEYIRSKCRMKITQTPTMTKPDQQALRDRYFVGENIFGNQRTAGQSVETILAHAAEDNLPGITPEKLAGFDRKLSAFTGKPGSQSNQQSVATGKRRQRDQIFAEVMRLRQEIQHAADGAWPWWEAVTSGNRPLFKLPAGRPLTAS